MDEILGEFIAETLETLDALSGEVVAWEADPAEKSRLDAFFRFFHTVKGSCGFLNLPRFEKLAHHAEEVLASIRQGDRVPDPATVTAVLAVMDRIGALARSIGEDEQIPESEDDPLLDALTANSKILSDGFEIFEPLPAKAAPLAIVEDDESKVETAPADQSARNNGSGRERAPRTIRLPLALIDQLMNGISDMVLARNDLARRMRESSAAPDLESSFERLSPMSRTCAT
jgi:two-component system chemotaxis sensor kinase CheA